MPALTLLNVVQSTLAATNSFEVDSIDDTPEAQSVAIFAEDVYFDFLAELPEWQFAEKLLSLESSLDADKPNYMKIPTGVYKIKYSTIEYNVSEDAGEYDYRTINYIEPSDFLDHIKNVSGDDTQEVTDYDGVSYRIRNDRHPTYFTTFDGVNLVFDSYNKDVDTTLQETKTRFVGMKERSFSRVDDFHIPLPNSMQQYYLAAVKAKASEYLTGEPLVSDIRKGQAGLVKARMKHQKVGVTQGRYSRRKNYGRK